MTWSPGPSGWFVSSWAFVLEPSADATRLLVRVRTIGGPAWLLWFLRLVLGKGDTVAHSSMLERIRARAEWHYQRSAEATAGATTGTSPVAEGEVGR